MMERTSKAALLPLDVGWSDLGSWSTLWAAADRDDDGNAVRGDALIDDATDCYIHADNTLISAIGVKDLVIVGTPDTVLVADRSRAQDVSRIVARLNTGQRPEQAHHTRCYRPWGFYETVSAGTGFQVKKLHVEPGRTLSMQMHRHRTEHWVVVRGTARVSFETSQTELRESQTLCIGPRQWHRLSNPGETPLELIEVQIGSYLGEDDIVRAETAQAPSCVGVAAHAQVMIDPHQNPTL